MIPKILCDVCDVNVPFKRNWTKKQRHNFWWKLKYSQRALKISYIQNIWKIPRKTPVAHIPQFLYKKVCNKSETSRIPEALLELCWISAMELFCGNFATKCAIVICESPNAIELVDVSLERSYSKFYCDKNFIIALVLKDLREPWWNFWKQRKWDHLPSRAPLFTHL